jgi:hypothetical protein
MTGTCGEDTTLLLAQGLSCCPLDNMCIGPLGVSGRYVRRYAAMKSQPKLNAVNNPIKAAAANKSDMVRLRAISPADHRAGV